MGSTGKVALVTGTSGIGAAATAAMLACGIDEAANDALRRTARDANLPIRARRIVVAREDAVAAIPAVPAPCAAPGDRRRPDASRSAVAPASVTGRGARGGWKEAVVAPIMGFPPPPRRSDGSMSCSSPAPAYVPVRPGIRRTVAEAAAFVRPTPVLRLDPALPRGRSRPVLVLPVAGRGDGHTAPMRAALDRLGYRTFGWDLGTNPGPTPRIVDRIERRLLTLHAAHGPVDLAGFSLGGVFARFLAHLHPDKVRQVATVCSPFREPLDSAFLPLRPLLRVWRTPDLPEIAARAARPLPVTGTFVFSRADGIVAWKSCIEPDQPADCFEIPGLHVTIARDPDVLAILARRFAREPPG